MSNKKSLVNWYTVQPPETALSQVLEEARAVYAHRSQEEIDELVDSAVKRSKRELGEARRLRLLKKQERVQRHR